MEEVNLYATAQVLLVGTKSDLTASRVVTTEQGKDLATHYGESFFPFPLHLHEYYILIFKVGIPFVEASAKTGDNVESIFTELAKLLANELMEAETKMNTSSSSTTPTTVSLQKQGSEPKRKKRCLV